MKLTRLFSGAAIAVVSAAVLTATASAYDLNKDLGFGWSASVTVPSEEFEGLTENSVITITYTYNASLADMEGHDYWVIKPMINDAGWPLIEGITGIPLSEGLDTYVVDTEATEMSFSVPAEAAEHLQIAGMAIMGHGIELGTMTINNDAAPAAPSEPVTLPDSIDVSSPSDNKGNPSTGVEGVAAVAGTAALAAGALLISRKRK